MQGGDALEIPAVDVQVKANGNVFQHTLVALRPTAADVEGDVVSGRVRLRGCALANSTTANDRMSHIIGVAQADAASGEYVKVRLQGCTQVAVHNVNGSAISDGEVLVLGGAGFLAKTVAATSEGGAGNDVGVAAQQGFRILAWSLEAGTATSGTAITCSRFKVCFNGMGWGSDEYTEV